MTKQSAPPQRADAQRTKSLESRDPARGEASSIHLLQRAIGNRALTSLLRTSPIQPKLTVSHPEDESEREADRVADEVMRMPAESSFNSDRQIIALRSSPVQRNCSGCEAEDEEEELQRKESVVGAAPPSPASVKVDQTLRSAGWPLDPITRSFMEERFGNDFSDIRIHTDHAAAKSARAINALAYTSGNHIAFAENQYSPATKIGQRLLAHELTHTIQQRHHLGPSGVAQRQPMPEGDVLPASVNVAWGGDSFTISFERRIEKGSNYFYFVIKYTGPHPVDGPSITDKGTQIRAMIGSGKLNARITALSPGKLVVDLEGYGDNLVTLVDKTRFDPRPNKGREHQFDVRVLGEGRSSSSIWIKDPKAQPEKQGQQPSIQTDVPGELPRSYIVGSDFKTTEIRIDGDGDQSKELLLRLKAKSYWPDDSYNKDRVKTVNLQITQISSKKILGIDFDLPEPTIQGGLFPVVMEVTDGGTPTKISLINPASSQLLLINPPTRDEKSVTYIAEAAGRRFSFIFPPEQTPRNTIASMISGKNIGGMKSVDIKLGAFNDTFRITLQSQAKTLKPDSPPKAIFGISALYRGKPVGGGMGAQIPQLAANQNLWVVETDGSSLLLDIDGVQDHQLKIYDRMTARSEIDGGGPPEKNRNHHIRVVGKDFGEKVFYFTVRDGFLSGGYANPKAEDLAADSNARAISGLSEQAKEGTFEKQLDAYEGALMAVRRKAADEHLIQTNTFTEWQELSTALIKLRPQINANKADPKEKIDPGLQAAAANHATKLYDLLAIETKGRAKIQSSFGNPHPPSVNPYTGESTVVAAFYSNVTKGAGAQLSTALSIGQWNQAYSLYNEFVDGLDRWILTRLKETKGEGSKEAQQAELLSKRKFALGEIEGKKPIAIAAVFHPNKKFETEAGYVSEIPLALYAYKEGDTWYLKNLTNPEKPYHVTASPSAKGEEPPIQLFNNLNDPDRFPEGRIHYNVPDTYGGTIFTTDHLTWKKFFTYLGLALAAVGFTLATFGTGTVAVVGGWALAGSAVAGGVAAGIDLLQGMQEGDLTTNRILMDVGQIVAAVAGVSALKSGMIVRGALNAAEEGAPLVGRAAEMAVFYQKVYVVSTATRLAADAVTVFAFSVETAQQLDDIEKGPGSRGDKDRAKALLLSQAAFGAGLFALTVKGELPQLGGGRKLVLHFPDKNGPPVANVGGLEAPTGLKFSQKDVSPLTGDKTFTIQELAESMKKGWKGSPLDVVELADGSKVSLDNRRLLAAQMAGIKEVPVAYHNPKEPFPPARAAADEFKLRFNIRQLDDGTLVIGGTKGKIAYPKDFRPSTFGEAALVRTANQGNLKSGVKFPLFGSFEQPIIRVPKGDVPKEE